MIFFVALWAACGNASSSQADTDTDTATDSDADTDSDSESVSETQSASDSDSDTGSPTDTGPCAGCDSSRGECVGDVCLCGEVAGCAGTNDDLCCAGACVDATSDPANCGECGETCTVCQDCSGGHCDVRADACLFDEDCGDCGPCFCPGGGAGCFCLGI